jgi:hypothetical protein
LSTDFTDFHRFFKRRIRGGAMTAGKYCQEGKKIRDSNPKGTKNFLERAVR